MKYLFTVLFLLTSTTAFSHEDHMLGEGTLHLTYHLVFWALFAGAVYKGLSILINTKKKSNSK